MRSTLKFGDDIQFSVVRGGRPLVQSARPCDVERFTSARALKVNGASASAVNIGIGGHFNVRCVRPDGSIRWRKEIKNGIANQGLNKLLNVQFQGATQITTWYLDLIATGATLAAADTYASHAGWSYTTTTNYSNATRPAWAPAASTAQSSTNAATVDFTIVATCTINGIAVVAGSSTKGDSASGSGVLWSTGSFPGGEQALVNGDTLKVTYTVNASAA